MLFGVQMNQKTIWGGWGGGLTGIRVNPRIEKYENESMEKAKQKRVHPPKTNDFQGTFFCFPGG